MSDGPTGLRALDPARRLDPPRGFETLDLFDPFEAYFGPYFVRDLYRGGREFALPLDGRHTNAYRSAHGGVIMSFIDAALGQAAWHASDWGTVVTMDMNVQFLTGAEEGDLLTLAPQITRQGRTVMFIRGDVMVDQTIVATASSVWKIVARG